MRDLSLVQRDDHDQESDAQPSDGATRVEVSEVLGSCLQTATNAENNCADQDRESATKPIACRSSKSRSEEGTTGEERDDSAAVLSLEKIVTGEGLLTFHWRLGC